jgi:hypothetical protein
VLNAWNDGMPTTKLHFVNNGEMILELILQPVLKVMGRAVACDWDGRGGGA